MAEAERAHRVVGLIDGNLHSFSSRQMFGDVPDELVVMFDGLSTSMPQQTGKKEQA